MDILKIKIFYDNSSFQKEIISAWGFSAFVSYGGRNILFDTGGKADLLLSNMKTMKSDPKEVTDVFISHNHWDHIGGLFGFLSKNHKVKVYLPSACSKTYANEVEACGAKCFRIKAFTKIAKNIYSSGELGEEIKEECLIVDTPKGLIVLTGCAHPGIISMLDSVIKKINKKIFAVFGGFHLAKKSSIEISEIISKFKKMGIVCVGACHCTGKTAIKQFKKEYGCSFVFLGAGSILKQANLSWFYWTTEIPRA